MVLAELVGSGKTYQDCYKRAKALKLKKANKEISKAISTKLIGSNKEVSQHAKNIKNKLVGDALKRVCVQTAKKQTFSFKSVKELCSFVESVSKDFAEFKKDESNKILFGRKTEMDDIRNATMHMRIVP